MFPVAFSGLRNEEREGREGEGERFGGPGGIITSKNLIFN